MAEIAKHTIFGVMLKFKVRQVVYAVLSRRHAIRCKGCGRFETRWKLEVRKVYVRKIVMVQSLFAAVGCEVIYHVGPTLHYRGRTETKSQNELYATRKDARRAMKRELREKLPF